MENNRYVGFAIKAISNEFMRFMDNRLRSGDITGMQHGILHFIANNQTDVFQRDVEREFNIRPSTATGILQLMEKNGFLRREPVTYDARLKKLVIINRGNELVKPVMEHVLETEKIITKNITSEELDIFFRVLDKITNNFKEYEEGDGL